MVAFDPDKIAEDIIIYNSRNLMVAFDSRSDYARTRSTTVEILWWLSTNTRSRKSSLSTTVEILWWLSTNAFFSTPTDLQQ